MTGEKNVPIIEAETYQQRLERMLQYEDVNHRYPNVQAVLTHPEGPYRLKEWLFTHNKVTDDGDIYYALLGAGKALPTDLQFAGSSGRMVLRTSADSTNKGDDYGDVLGAQLDTSKVLYTGYPTTNDTDGDNTASNKQRKVTWRYEWLTGDFARNGIFGGCIHAAGGSPGSSTKILTHFSFSESFDKTSQDTLKVIINHELLGV